MAAKFDNIDDVMSKFVSTICYYEEKPVMVKNACISPENPEEFLVLICGLNGRGKHIPLNSPAFNYKKYNLGYANSQNQAVWWFRRPIRQYHQGLKRNQLGYLVSTYGGFDDNFNFAKPFTTMLENSYPSIDACQKMLLDKVAATLAFHKDFAINWDEIHRDYILEYRGRKIGTNINQKLNQYRLIDEAKYLYEALEEALDV